MGLDKGARAHLWGRAGECCDLGAPVVASKCLSASVAPSSMVSKVFLSWLRVFDSGFDWERFLFSKCDWFIVLIRS